MAWATDTGMTQMITASLGGGNNPTMDDVNAFSRRIHQDRGNGRRGGDPAGLHNEGFEASTVDGQRTYDLLMNLLHSRISPVHHLG
jgi:hypothetical protein